MKEWSQNYYVYDFGTDKLLKTLGSYKQARKYADKKLRAGVEAVITLERVNAQNKIDKLYVYDPEDKEFSLSLKPKPFWKQFAKSNSVRLFEEFPVRVLELIHERAMETYHNSGEAFLTDRQFDFLEKIIRKEHPKSLVLKKVGADVKITDTRSDKVKLTYHLGSMDKMQDFMSWDTKGPWIVTEKLDGVSLLYENLGGELKLSTRGNGTIGQDVSHLITALRLPKIRMGMAVRGELMLSKALFKKYAKNFANPRNMIAGLVNRKSVASELRDADFVAFEIMNPRKKPSKQYEQLKALGFKTPKQKLITSLDSETLLALLKDWRKNSQYNIDGLVVYDDNKHPLNTSGNPDYAKAFKKNSADDMQKATVTGISWEVSRTGQIKPTVLIKPIQIQGTKVSRATGHNAKNIVDNKIGKGALIKIIKSGDIIPYIVEVLKPGKVEMPEEEWEWNATNTDIILKAGEVSQSKTVNSLAFALSNLGVENVGSGLVTLLVEEGLDTLPKIRGASTKKISNIIGPNRGQNLQDDLEFSLKKAELIDLMVASGVFAIGFGRRKFASLLATYPKFGNFTPEKIKGLDAAPGFSSASMQKLAEAKPEFDKWLKDLRMDPPKVKVDKAIKGRYTGKVYAFSGVRDAEIKSLLEKEGGVVENGVTGKVTHLIVKDKMQITNKVRAAIAKGLTIQSLDEIKKELGL